LSIFSWEFRYAKVQYTYILKLRYALGVNMLIPGTLDLRGSLIVYANNIDTCTSIPIDDMDEVGYWYHVLGVATTIQ
jgi:hypothetical protein